MYLGVLTKLRGHGTEVHLFLPLIVGEVRELIEAHGKRLLLISVVSLDHPQVVRENLQALHKLLSIRDIQIILGNMVVEELLKIEFTRG